MRATGLAVLVAALGLLGACRPAMAEPEASASPTSPVVTPEVPSPEPTSVPEIPSGLERLYEQELAWEACDEPDLDGLECAWLTVPLDYADPGGQTIEIAVARSTAEDSRGSLVLNPGGPGESGADMVPFVAEAAGERLTDTFDLVGFDPRGVKRSAPVSCGVDQAVWYRVLYDLDASTPEGEAEAAALWAEIGEGCAAGTGGLLGHVDTVSAARDMDVLRAALGESTLTFLGFSYGTRLGQTYAALFPRRVGRFVLDGAYPATTTPAQDVAALAAELETSLRAYAADCLQQAGCPWSGSVDDAVAQIGDVLDRAPSLDTGEDRTLTSAMMVWGVIQPMVTDPRNWEGLTLALQAAVDDGDGSLLLQAFDFFVFAEVDDDDPLPIEQVDDDAPLGDDIPALELADVLRRADHDAGDAFQSLEALQAIHCADGRGDPAEARTAAMAVAPTVGKYYFWQFGTSVVCGDWPTPAVGPLPSYSAEGAAPIVVVGSTGDLRTPYVWAQVMAETFSSAVLVTFDGDGHCAYLVGGSSCVDDLVEAYLVDGTLPPGSAVCTV